MQQPKSIERFEQLFFLRIAVSVVVTILNWNQALEQLSRAPALARFGQAYIVGSLAISLAVSLLLWFFIARRGSEVAKWIYIVFYAIGWLGLLSFVMPRPEGVEGPNLIAQFGLLANLVLGGISVWLLFRPDTRAWFNKGVDPTQ